MLPEFLYAKEDKFSGNQGFMGMWHIVALAWLRVLPSQKSGAKKASAG
jgi:hypothetical protein